MEPSLEWTPLLASPADLAERLHAASTDTGLLLALRRASARFVDEVGHPIVLVKNDETWLSGDGSCSILLPAFPVVGDPTIHIDGVAVTDWEIGRARGLLRRKAAIWPDGLDNIRIVWSHGFASIPAGIQDAVLEQAETQYYAITAVASRSAGGESITFSAQASLGVTQRWSDAVSRYSIGGGEDL